MELLPLDTRTGKVKQTSSRVGTEPKPIDFSEVFVIGLGDSASQSAITPLVNGQSYIDVTFEIAQTDADWVFMACSVFNTVDPAPLNIWPGITTSKTATGFRLQLNGMPDSGNYYLHWAISGVSITPVPATTYVLSGPATGGIGVASTFTVHLPASTTIAAPVTVTPSDGGGGGAFTPTSVVLNAANRSRTFTYTPVSYGAKTISTTNNGGLTDPAGVSFTCVAATYTLSGPSTGASGVPSTNFTVALPAGGVVVGTVNVTPGAGVGGGTFTPSTVALTTAAPSATFTYTPASVGAKTISVTNDGGLTNPVNLTYTATTPPMADGDPVSTWPDSSVNGNNATQTGSARPIYKTNIVNSKPVVRFTSAGHSGLNLASAISGAAPWTIFSVMKSNSSSVNLYLLASSTTSPYGPIQYNDGNLYVADRAKIAGALPNPAHSAFHVFTGQAGVAVDPKLWVDGTLLAVSVSARAHSSNFENLGYYSLVPDYSDGDIAEIAVYNVVVGSTDQANIEKYLGTKYGITVAGGSAVQPDTVSGLVAWWKADSL